MPNPIPPAKITFPRILDEIGRLRDEAFGTTPERPENLDRIVVLHRLIREFQTDEAELLRWGFDRAYRQIIEGI